MDKHIIIGVHIAERLYHAGAVQQVFTRLGSSINTRLGRHEAGKTVCSPTG